MTNRTFGFGLLAVMLAHHWGLWFALSAARDLPLLDLINQWDAALYTTIVQDGPSGALWAFFPLYPLVVKLAWSSLNANPSAAARPRPSATLVKASAVRSRSSPNFRANSCCTAGI
jgi:hypothetical protein